MTMLYNSMYPKIGINTSDATATAGDILSGKIAYGSNGRLVGTIPSVNIGVPSISVNASGLITATTTQSGGYVSSGTKSATHQLTTQSAAIITPGTSQKVAVPSGRYTTGAVTVQGSANLVPENIRSGVNIFGVTGTASSSKSAEISIIQNRNDTGAYLTICYIDKNGTITEERLDADRPTTIECMAPGIVTISLPPREEENSQILDDGSPLELLCETTYATIYGVTENEDSSSIFLEIRPY